jgi:uncharacterized protein (TIGR01777 family)
MRVLVAGASGFIGTELCAELERQGHTVLRLVRGQRRSSNEYAWSPDEYVIDQAAIDAADAVVNLAAATTGRVPWGGTYKKKILHSRVRGTQTLAEAIAASKTPPAVFINGSAVGYYGDRPGEKLDETSSKGEGFLSDVVEAWELAAQLTPPTTRLVLLRTGVVIGNGGALTPLIPLTLLGLGARLGAGTQVWPWVSLRDEAAAIVHLLDSELSGVVNVAGPTAATSAQITSALARTLHRWHPWVVPAWAIRLLGDSGEQLLLWSQNVEPTRLVDDGFEFEDATIESAFTQLNR